MTHGTIIAGLKVTIRSSKMDGLRKLMVITLCEATIGDDTLYLEWDVYNNMYVRTKNDEWYGSYYITELQVALDDYKYHIEQAVEVLLSRHDNEGNEVA